MSGQRVVPVRVRILAAILVVTALGLLSAGSVAYLLQRGREIAEIDEELMQELDDVRLVVSGGGADVTGDRSDLDVRSPAFATTAELMHEIVRTVTPGIHASAVGIVDGEAAFVPGVATPFPLTDPGFVSAMVEATGGERTIIGTTDGPDERSLRYIAVPVGLTGSDSTGLFVSAVDVDGRLQDLHGVMTIFWWVAGGALVMVGLVGWFVAGRLLSPVRELRDTAARITATDLGERIPVAGNDDLSELTRTINEMIARLDESFHGQQRLLDDVRHELSTPLTIVRGHLELVDPHDPEDVAQAREVALDELDRMSGLVADIAALADAERAAMHRPGLTRVDRLTREVFEKLRVLPGHDWALEAAGHGTAVLDASRVTQAWLQLADNAAKYAPAGSRIGIGSDRLDDAVRFWVRDEGPGIPPEAHERIFERFGRADEARGVAGSGLGLSIVLAIVRQHEGRVEVESAPGRGALFRIEIPLRQQADPPTEAA
ncbi:sensor histidine kinase [Microbacterium marinilacus]|uniref:histidine kinase n=1 Tax=Microbacterium marinilacus TaxID=415209 RepID=A0ABP7BB37_9MICO|nr:HAMP domain-containing sensor histidine kinase [Microbacterium marinilacus]MBY0687154.1 HAMP domain-containing histidine kinase [Microbacterium marinilacus]